MLHFATGVRQPRLSVTTELGTADCFVDSGASTEYASRSFIERLGCDIEKTEKATANLGDGSTIKLLGRATFDVKYDHSTEKITAWVIETDRFDFIFGRTWLQKHNPFIDWRTAIVTLNIDGTMQKIRPTDRADLSTGPELALTDRHTFAKELQYGKYDEIFLCTLDAEKITSEISEVDDESRVVIGTDDKMHREVA